MSEPSEEAEELLPRSLTRVAARITLSNTNEDTKFTGIQRARIGSSTQLDPKETGGPLTTLSCVQDAICALSSEKFIAKVMSESQTYPASNHGKIKEPHNSIDNSVSVPHREHSASKQHSSRSCDEE